MKFPKFFGQGVTNHGNFTVPGNCCLLVTTNNSPQSGKFPWGCNKKTSNTSRKMSKTENKKGGAVTQLGCFFTPEQKTHTNHWLDCPCFRSEEVFHSPYFFPKSKQFHLKTDWVSPGPKEFERGKTHATVKTHNRSVPTGSNSLTGGDAMFNTKGSGEA